MTINVNVNQEIVTFSDIEICDVFRYDGCLWLKIDNSAAFKFYSLTDKCAEYDTDDFWDNAEVTPVKAKLNVEI